MSIVDLGKVDLLVEEGFYSNRTDFIRTSIRNQLNSHETSVQQSVTRKSFAMGSIILDRADFERIKAAGEKRTYSVIGLLHINDDVPADLAAEVIEKITVRGMFRASEAVKAALADRMG
jgi:Arc/MetJ-type ribon-helix-helix transcriptional regulator